MLLRMYFYPYLLPAYVLCVHKQRIEKMICRRIEVISVFLRIGAYIYSLQLRRAGYKMALLR